MPTARMAGFHAVLVSGLARPRRGASQDIRAVALSISRLARNQRASFHRSFAVRL